MSNPGLEMNQGNHYSAKADRDNRTVALDST